MREIFVICESHGQSRQKAATVLDRYLWRIGSRSWRGNASNAALKRMTDDLKSVATKATAIRGFEMRSTHESRMPLFTIGNGRAFADGAFNVKTSTRSPKNSMLSSARAALLIAALFHDIGKMSAPFQAKLKRFLAGDDSAPSDPVRHELISAMVFDQIFGRLSDAAFIGKISKLTAADLDGAWKEAENEILDGVDSLSPAFLKTEGTLAQAVGLLILSHHKLPKAEVSLQPKPYITSEDLDSADVARAKGTAIWHDARWMGLLKSAGKRLKEGGVPAFDLHLRAALVLGDHLGSSEKEVSHDTPEYLANTITGKDRFAADDLMTHTLRVSKRALGAHDMITCAAWPALQKDQVPSAIAEPQLGPERFRWQVLAARKAAEIAAQGGGFFACLSAGTGTGKTRGAPTILAGATFADPDPERQGLRFVLGLGLRTLAMQSAKEYVKDLGFSPSAVKVMIGTPPITFDEDDEEQEKSGSASSASPTDWFDLQDLPETEDFIASLSIDLSGQLPEIVERYARKNHGGPKGRDLLATPIICGTLDQVIASAAPMSNSRFIFPAFRVMTSDLIIDEIDQFAPEDLAVISRLAWQCGASGRRLIIASATVSDIIVKDLFASYRAGWSEYARLYEKPDRVAALVTADTAESVAGDSDVSDITRLRQIATQQQIEALNQGPANRHMRQLPEAASHDDIMGLLDREISRLHEDNHILLNGRRVSFGFVRVSRVKHAMAIAKDLRAQEVMPGRYRLKLCLHSRFPALHRSWIEDMLKKVLTRKTSPAGGLEDLVASFNLPEEVQDLEIALICTQVIETGNDLDFDWAILDPSESRAIVQAAGRVRRHRPGAWEYANISLFGTPLTSLKNGRMEYPGVESEQPTLSKEGVTLPKIEQKNVSFLTHMTNGSPIDARFMHPVAHEISPLRDAEFALLELYLSGKGGPDQYRKKALARLSAVYLNRRKFRNSPRREVYLTTRHDEIAPGPWVWTDDFIYAKNPVNVQPLDLHIKGALTNDIINLARKTVESRAEDLPAWSRIQMPELKDPPMVSFHPVLGMLNISAEDMRDLRIA